MSRFLPHLTTPEPDKVLVCKLRTLTAVPGARKCDGCGASLLAADPLVALHRCGPAYRKKWTDDRAVSASTQDRDFW